MEDSWAFEYMKSEDVEELAYKSEKILIHSENGIVLNVSLSNAHCMNLVHDWYNAVRNNNMQSTVRMHLFFQGFIDYVSDHLIEENLDWKKDRYNEDDNQ